MAATVNQNVPESSIGRCDKLSPRKRQNAWLANGIFVIYTHIVGVGALCLYRPAARTLLLAVSIWFIAGLGRL
jgi:hypothetical protein